MVMPKTNPYRGLTCPTCGTHLIEVQQTAKADGYVMRRRKCFNDHTFVTREEVVDRKNYNEWHRDVYGRGRPRLKEPAREH